MEYIHGSTPVAFCGKPEHNACRFGTSDQDWNLREQIAAIQIALATMQFPQIGSLCQDRANGQVFIGKESRMGRGPWLDSLWFYHDLADSTMRKTVEVADRRVLGDYSAAVPALFKQVMATYVEGTAQHGPFGLLHLGLGAHNVLVDHNFRVVGLMDVGSIIAGPVEMQALYPACTRIGRKIPYCQVYQPQELHHLSMIQPRFLSTNECLKSARRILVRI